MDINNAIIDTEKAYAHNWGSIALGTLLWNLYVGIFIVVGSMLLGLLLGCFGISENHAYSLLWIGSAIILLAAVGPFTAGYIKFIVEAIKNKRCCYHLLFSGFRNFGTTFLIGFYIWSIMMAYAIVCLLFFYVYDDYFPGRK
ncbi:MAG: hypothetical protein HDR88_16880 [Bacteroides sp.]|nr:hypothetical protein [Bacteroides sp.]